MQTDWILWGATLGLEGDLRTRLETAAACGVSGTSLSPLDVSIAEESGWSAAQIGADARALGLSLILDPVMNWCPGPASTTSRFGRFSAQESMRMARELDITSLTLLAPRAGDVTVEQMLEPFALICDQAAEFGAAVHPEFIPMTRIPDLAAAWTMVQGVDRPNAGILLDTWHYYRGNPDRELLLSIPGDRILAVQVDDAMAVPLDSLWDDTRERLMPGDGELDLVGVLRDLHAIDGLQLVGPEVLSTHWNDLARTDPVAVGRLGMERTRELVERACAS